MMIESVRASGGPAFRDERWEHELAPGECLSAADPALLWRLTRGAMRIDCLSSRQAGKGARELQPSQSPPERPPATRTSSAPAAAEPDDAGLVRLALPGDVLGVEVLAGITDRVAAQAITPCTLVPVRLYGQHDVQQLLVQAVLQGHQRCRDMVTLRTGPAAARLRRLLLLLGDSDQSAASEGCTEWILPSLKDMATLIDVAPETVSRVLGNWRRLDVLQDRRPSAARFNRSTLREHPLHPGMTASTPAQRPACAESASLSSTRTDSPGGCHVRASSPSS